MDFIKPQLLLFIVFNIPPVPFLHTIKHHHCRGSFRFTVFRQSWSKYLCQNVFMSKLVIDHFTDNCMIVHKKNKTTVVFSHIPPSPTIKVVLVYQKDHSKGSFKIWVIQYSMQLN